MSHLSIPPYVLQELPDITETIKYPIKNVQRIKFTCFDVSKTLIAFGATSGGIYVFNRSPCEFTQLIPHKDGTITRLIISPNEKHIGFANGKGVVAVSECSQSLSGSHSVVTSKEHNGNEVTVLAWRESNLLFCGDDVGKISVLQLQNFIAKTFQSSSQAIMHLDSRICQIDVKAGMLLVSTLTRCYICDTSQEQYRQIGQKPRDGEYGACFVCRTKQDDLASDSDNHLVEVKQYNMVNEALGFAVDKKLSNTSIFCARPSSRLWEATVDGTVIRTHQFKQVLAKRPMKVVTVESYEREEVSLESEVKVGDGLSVNFSKIFCVNGVIFSFKKDAIFFLNVNNVNDSIWLDSFNDIVDCKVYGDMVYIWLSSGSLVSVKFMSVDKFLVKCYVEEKYVMCAKMCALFRDYLNSDGSGKLSILVGLREKLADEDLLSDIGDLLDKFESLKEDTLTKSGIHVVDNTFNAQNSLLNDTIDRNDDYKFSTLPPDAMQTLKDLSVSVSDTINTSKKLLKEKWEGFEGKMKHLGTEKQQVPEVILPKITLKDSYEPVTNSPIIDEDIIYKISSHKAIDNNNLEHETPSELLYQHYRLSLVGKNTRSNLVTLVESNACDIRQIYTLLSTVEQYCVSIGTLEESKYVPNELFLSYLSDSTKKEEYLEEIINDEVLYKYFVESCILVNMKNQKLLNVGCECGFPLPYIRTNQTPLYSELIDVFIERQWSCKPREQCYDVCKQMPYLWRKILYLRRNEDLQAILRILLQMLDETLLHSFLPQFTVEIWDRTVQLYATLHANLCLNCGKKFNHISVKDTLSWDDVGAMMVKSIGGKKAVELVERHAHLIDPGALTVKFYHTCLLVTMFEKFDSTVRNQLTDAIYSSYSSEDSRLEICKLLRSTMNGIIKCTALPIIVAAKSTFWGLNTNNEATTTENDEIATIDRSMKGILDNLHTINNGVTDCALCGLPLQNEVLIKDGGLWVFKCGHTFHGVCTDLNKIRLCPSCGHVK